VAWLVLVPLFLAPLLASFLASVPSLVVLASFVVGTGTVVGGVICIVGGASAIVGGASAIVGVAGAVVGVVALAPLLLVLLAGFIVLALLSELLPPLLVLWLLVVCTVIGTGAVIVGSCTIVICAIVVGVIGGIVGRKITAGAVNFLLGLVPLL